MNFEYRHVNAHGMLLRVAMLDGPGGSDPPPPLLMLNGIGFNAELMEPLAMALAAPGPDAPQGRAVVIPDMPGCGGSPDHYGASLMLRLSAAADQLMEALHPGTRYDLLGFSWGGALAQQIAIQYSRRITRLALVSTISGLPVTAANPDVMKRLFDPVEYSDPTVLAANFRALLAEGGAGAGLLKRFKTCTPQALTAQLMALAGWTAAPMLPFIRVPVALVGVADDAVVPFAHQQMLNCLMPEARQIQIPSGGHLAALAQPGRVADDLRAFLSH